MEMNSGIINKVFDKKFQVQVGEDLKESFFCCRNSSKSPLTMSTFSSKSVLSMTLLLNLRIKMWKILIRNPISIPT